RPPARRRRRVWHARRNNEMAVGILLRHLTRMPLKLLFTSAAQRRHTAYTKWLIRRMDAVIATSDRSGSFLEVPHTVIQHGVDLALFHPPVTAEDGIAATGLPGRHLVGCFGRVRHQKGTDLFVRAMIELLPQHTEWTAVVSGRVTAEHVAFADKLKADVVAAGLSDRILFLGEVPDIKIWYRRLTLYVAPSRNEGFGLTPLEAMASRTAVVASDAGAYAELIVTGETGSVVAAGDGEALTRAIAPYIADPALAVAHGENALRHVSANFALEKEASAIGAVYNSLLGDNRS
ncbi:glycosyltransferase family 4 protein, partial [Rhizobium sp. PRIMUS64]|uniref:glycosyltransferase family 4 protein n=1 Tax=Rhizobium sp. PRIMUS64 TaxID=2908925 RepID=UPI001FF2DAC2